MTTVQIAIRNRRYAAALRDLLVADGNHCVYMMDRPSAAIGGIVVVDDTIVDRLRGSQEFDFSRFIVFIHRLNFDADRLFAAGVRYVIHVDSPPETGRLIVVAAERRFREEAGKPIAVAEIFNAADQLFLQALRIDAR
ncbi:MAG TPA: hypothetical protein VFW44_03935 [Bryobacteraceae bacterium]|nr:hypothetical protein [Bryobacteraceae bacterium]